jgi:hypothetical protein
MLTVHERWNPGLDEMSAGPWLDRGGQEEARRWWSTIDGLPSSKDTVVGRYCSTKNAVLQFTIDRTARKKETGIKVLSGCTSRSWKARREWNDDDGWARTLSVFASFRLQRSVCCGGKCGTDHLRSTCMVHEPAIAYAAIGRDGQRMRRDVMVLLLCFALQVLLHVIVSWHVVF